MSTPASIHKQGADLQEAPCVNHQRTPDHKADGHESEGDRALENTGAVKPPDQDARANGDLQEANRLKHRKFASVFFTVICASLSSFAGVWGLPLFVSIYVTARGALHVAGRVSSDRKGDPAAIADLTHSRLPLAVVASSLYYVGPDHGGMAYLPMLAFSGFASAFADYSAWHAEAAS